MKGKLVAIGGLIPGSDNADIHGRVLEASGRMKPKICFVPLASGDYELYVELFHQQYPTSLCRPRHLSLVRHIDDDPQHVLADQDIVYLGGGSIPLLVAAGRKTFLKELGVEAIGIDPETRFLSGDVAAADILGNPIEPLNLEAMSAVTFTDPEVGAVGLTEAQAIEAGINVAVASKPVAHTAGGWLHASGNEGFIKLVVDSDRQVLVGATSVGPVGGEVLGMLSLAVHAKIPISTLKSMIYAYPTFHKGVEDTLNELG